MPRPAAAVNVLWAAACAFAWRRLRAALRNPRKHQEQLLLEYLRRNRSTAFGRMHGFADIDSVATYQSRVPRVTYDDLEPWIRRVASGEQGVLTRTPVARLVPSGGSTSAAKLIPFTPDLQHEFSRAIDAWMFELFASCPALAGGPAYWSITPAVRVATPFATAIPVGFDDDASYLGGTRQALARTVMAVPSHLRLLGDPDAFRYVTLLFLTRARDLRLVSVWHPSFFAGLLELFSSHRERIARDVANGTITPPGSLTPEERCRLVALSRPDPRRAAEIHCADVAAPRTLWPDLSLISCWGDGPAIGVADALGRVCPGVRIQPKGLLATEGVVTIPLAGRHPLAVRSHFFEFVGGDGRVRLANELEAGHEYSILLTTGGGLYRYELGDRVRVDGFVERTPSLRFVGKDDRVSDWFGEKLSEGFVARTIASMFPTPPRFALLAPERTESGMAYTLFVEAPDALPADLGARLEAELRRNPHYAWCIDLGQLRPARVIRVGPESDRLYVDACVARGQRLGDVKPAALRGDVGWERALTEMAPIREAAS